MYSIRTNDFDIRKIAYSGQCFRINRLRGNVYSAVAMGHYVEIKQDGDEITFSCSQEEFEKIWKPYFDLELDYGDIVAKAVTQFGDDKFLMDAIEYGRGIRILRQDFFETLISFVISQRKSIRSIKRCVETMCSLYGERIAGATFDFDYVVEHDFPTPEALCALEIDELKECGVGYRAEYISAAARWYLDRGDDYRVFSTGYQTASNILRSEIYGVGIKIANCVSLFGLHHMCACPIDVWMQRIIDQYYQGGLPKWMDWEYAGLLQQYCFFYIREC